MTSLNWGDLINEAGDVGYEPLPDGDYDLKVVEASAKVTQTGKTMFAIKAQVTTGAHAKRLVWDNLVVTTDNPNALAIFFRKMGALGLGRDFFSTSPSNAQIEQALVDRTFRGQVGSRTWQGQKKNEIKAYYSANPTSAVASAAPAAPPAPAPAPTPQAAPAPQTAPAAAEPVAAAAPAPTEPAAAAAAPPQAPF
jgi:hypothetical protein